MCINTLYMNFSDFKTTFDNNGSGYFLTVLLSPNKHSINGKVVRNYRNSITNTSIIIDIRVDLIFEQFTCKMYMCSPLS